MLKITIENVTQVSEDHLYITLESLSDSDPLKVLIESELDRRAEWRQNCIKMKHVQQLKELQEQQRRQLEISNLLQEIGTKKVNILISLFGEEFEDEYYIDYQTFTVYSKATNPFCEQTNSWEFETLILAKRKMEKLIYDRIYNKFMRDATDDTLALLHQIMRK